LPAQARHRRHRLSHQDKVGTSKLSTAAPDKVLILWRGLEAKQTCAGLHCPCYQS
jgi:hypothetical protein